MCIGRPALGFRHPGFYMVLADSSSSTERLMELIYEGTTVRAFTGRLPNATTITVELLEGPDVDVVLQTVVELQVAFMCEGAIPGLRTVFPDVLPETVRAGERVMLDGVGGLPVVFLPDLLWNATTRLTNEVVEIRYVIASPAAPAARSTTGGGS